MIILACDHGGFQLKEELKKYFNNNKIEFLDVGALEYNKDDDYPDFSLKGVKQVLKDELNRGIFICGSGIGMNMSANRHKGIRAVCANDVLSAQLARKDEDANVLCLGAKYITKIKAIKIIKEFLSFPFEGGRHQRRINKY